MKTQNDYAAERAAERARVKAIVAMAPPELREEAINLALNTELSVEQCATQLLALAGKTDRAGNGHHERPGLWAAALREVARRRLER